jgi:hypothetical protein
MNVGVMESLHFDWRADYEKIVIYIQVSRGQ